MFKEEYQAASYAAANKYNMLKSNPAGYFLLSMLAGAYVGFGVLLVYTLGAVMGDSPFTKFIMGTCFGVALSLVMIAGSELFTGNNFVMAAGFLRKTVDIKDACKVWAVCWIGNLSGAVILAIVYNLTGLYSGATLGMMIDSAAAKMSAGLVPLLTRGMLCNTLVCLAVWSGYRTNSDTAKLIMVFWCILAFFATGFEHSVANMTLLTLSLINNGGNETISFGGYIYNLSVVTIGNMIGPILFVSIPYHIAAKDR